MSGAGSLVVVGTPIGNLGDLSPRAADALGRADAIACAEPERTRDLLGRAGVPVPELVPAGEAGWSDAADAAADAAGATDGPGGSAGAGATAAILARLAGGQRVALVGTAGMPTVAEPGHRLVAAALAAGYAVDVVPGPVAATAALALSGLPGDRFVFEGFLPPGGEGRAARLAALGPERRTIVLYEAADRLGGTLADLVGVLGGDRPVAVVGELTRPGEEVARLTLAEAVEAAARSGVEGELVLVVAGTREPAGGEVPGDDELLAALRAELAGGASRRDAAARVAAATGAPRRAVYDLALRAGRLEQGG